MGLPAVGGAVSRAGPGSGPDAATSGGAGDGRLAGLVSVPSPTLETLAVVFGVYMLQLLAAVVAGAGAGADLFVLRPPVLTRPWTLLTTVYAHAGPVHLVTNALVLLPTGLYVERFTTRGGFHLLFVCSGLVAAATVVVVGASAGLSVGAIGASGAVFALVGYAVTGRPGARRVRTGLGVRAPGTGAGGRGRGRGRGRSRTEGRPGPGPGLFLLFGLGLVVFPLLVGRQPLVALGHAIGFGAGLVAGALGWASPQRPGNRSLK